MDNVVASEEHVGESAELVDLPFEVALNQLEETVAALETGELSLETALELFERGQRLAKYCSQKLEKADLRLEQLTEDGEIVEISLDN